MVVVVVIFMFQDIVLTHCRRNCRSVLVIEHNVGLICYLSLSLNPIMMDHLTLTDYQKDKVNTIAIITGSIHSLTHS